MESRLDIRSCLDQLGFSWKFFGSVTEGTMESWCSVIWADSRDKPTWEQLVHVSLRGVMSLKAEKQREIATAADAFLSSLATEYGAYEKLTWDQQAIESDALLSDPAAPAPLVRAIATARGMTALEMANRIAANRAQWVALSGAVVGKRLAYQDALDAAQTVEEVAAIVPVFP